MMALSWFGLIMTKFLWYLFVLVPNSMYKDMDYHLLTEFLALSVTLIPLGWSIYLLAAQFIDWDPSLLPAPTPVDVSVPVADSAPVDDSAPVV